MAKKKSKKIEKETRRLIEGIGDLVKKKKGDGYKFKTRKKKEVKKIKKTCPHWIIRKGKEVPTIMPDVNPANWKCTICGATFPIRPGTDDEYQEVANKFLSYVNQVQFFSIKMGGNADDTKLLLQLKQLVPRYIKAQKNIIKTVNKRQEWEDRNNQSDSMSQFSSFSGFSYR